MDALRYALMLSLGISFGWSTIASATPRSSSWSTIYAPFMQKSHLHSSISIDETNYLGPAPNDVSSSSVSYVYGHLLGHFGDEAWSSKVNLSGQYAFDPVGENYLWVNEVFTQFRLNESHSAYLSIGRKLESWSDLDSMWDLDLWQPQVTVDPLNITYSGLPGAFFSIKPYEDFEFLIWASPFYLPDDGAKFSVTEGRLRSENRWYSAPPEAIQLFRGRSGIDYVLKKPSVWSVIDHGGGAAQLRYNYRQPGFWGRTSYAYKPSEQFYFGLKAYQNVDVTVVEINPMVYYQHLVSTDIGYSWSRGSTFLSLSHERPDKIDLPPYWLGTELHPTTFVGLTTELNLPSNSSWILSYLHYFEDAQSQVVRHETVKVESVGSSEASKALLRFRYSDAIASGIRVPLLHRKKEELNLNLKVIYSIADGGTILSPELTYKPEPAWDIYVNADVLTSGKDEGTDPSFIAKYRSNDRMMGGVRYVF
jgi:hypothetical protein